MRRKDNASLEKRSGKKEEEEEEAWCVPRCLTCIPATLAGLSSSRCWDYLPEVIRNPATRNKAKKGSLHAKQLERTGNRP